MEELSDYEKLRLENIARNNQKLASLNLEGLKPKHVPKKKAAKRNRSDDDDEDFVPRRSSRVSGGEAVNYAAAIDNDMDDDEEYVSDDDSGDDEALPMPKRIRAEPKRKAPAREIPAPLEGTEDSSASGLTVELAKTGRSTCRQCREKIEKDQPRVGMQAWIVGRQALTWQCPPCFLQNLILSLEATGRGKCKLTSQAFPRGAAKLGCRSHTAVSYFSLDAAPRVLKPVLKTLKADQGETFPAAESIEGFDELESEDMSLVRNMVTQVLAEASAATKTPKVEEDAMDTEAAEETKKAVKKEDKSRKHLPDSKTRQETQPALGKKTNTKGRVVWKFGGCLCYGNLIAASETATQCFARTHKGNVKTLAKGKDYWWLDTPE